MRTQDERNFWAGFLNLWLFLGILGLDINAFIFHTRGFPSRFMQSKRHTQCLQPWCVGSGKLRSFTHRPLSKLLGDQVLRVGGQRN